MAESLFVWCDTTGLGRNVFVFFRRSFRLAGDPDKQVREAALHLFADTRYRLWVNGEVAAYGPARFLPTHPEYDTVDLRPWLRKGANALVVEANSFGAKSFEARPSVGGFIGWGKVRTSDEEVDLSTPGEWKMRRAQAWDEDAPAYSFAQAPVEILDMQKVPTGVHGSTFDDRSWAAPVVVARQDAWGELQPRSIPMLTMDLHEPEKVLIHSALAANEEIVGGRVPGERPDGKGRPVRCCYCTNIYSPRDQDVTLGMFWGPHFLNGRQVGPVENTSLGNREDYPVRLRAGWNFLYGEPELLAGQWGVLIALPRGKGLVAAAEQDANCAETAVFSEGLPEDVLHAARSGAVPAEMAQMPRLDVLWHSARRGEPIPLPARLIGWDTPVSRQVERPNTVRDLQTPAGQDWVVLLDFGKQFLGHIMLDVEAAPGTILDVAYDERIRDDGLVAIYRAHWGIDNADRFITVAGRQRIEGFRPRGARYVQIAVRNAAEPVVLHGAWVRNTLCPVQVEGRFECSDPVLNWVWSTGVETIRITMEDNLSADSWRERAMYVNDSVVIYNCAATFWSDPAMIRRCLRLWAYSQDADGLIPAVTPAWWGPGSFGATQFWVALLHDYVQRTADVELLRELWPNVLRVFASPRWVEGPRGLLGNENEWVWFDQTETAQRQCGENGVLNAHRYAALCQAAVLAGMLKDRRAATRFRARARRVKRAFQALWDEKAGRYATTLHDGQPDPLPAPHANVLALLYGLAEGARAQAALAYVEDYLSDEKFLAPAHLELYFHFWALEVLYQYGRVALAEHVMRRTWGLMKNAGAWTFWEATFFTLSNTGQMCQGWSSAPLIAMARRILGVRPAPGRPREVLIAPTAATLAFARGAVAHPAGPIEVDWRLHEGDEGRWLELAVSAPQALKVRIAPEGVLAGIPVRATVRKR